MTPVQPVPVVRIGGVALGVGANAALVPLDELSVNWGRSTPFGGADPSTASLRVFDTSSRWPLTGDLIGTTVEVTASRPGLDPVGIGYSYRPFWGRITDVDIVPGRMLIGGQWVDGLFVTLGCGSMLTDLANRVPAGAWPAETVSARAARIAGAAGPSSWVLQYGVSTPLQWGPKTVAPVAAGNTDPLLTHLDNLYASCGAVRWSWDPAGAQAAAVQRYSGFTERTLGRLVRATETTDGRYGQGAYPVTVLRTNPNSGETIDGGLTLDAGHLTTPDGGPVSFTRSMGSRISDVQVSYFTGPDGAGNYTSATATATVAGASTVTEGARTASVSTILVGSVAGQACADEWAASLGQEGRAWQPTPVRYRPARHGGFESTDVMLALLNGFETGRPWFLTGLEVSAQLGLRPVFGLIGGTIAYIGGEWVFDLVLTPLHTAAAQHAITPAEVDDGTTPNRLKVYLDGLPHADGLHRSVTATDLHHIGRGLGLSSVGPDTGWDTLQS